MKLGINTNNQCGKDYVEILKNIKDAGFDSVMIAFNLKDDENIIKEAQRLNLYIPYVHLDYKFGNDLWIKGASADEYVDNVIKQVGLCGKYNIKTVVFHCTWGSPNDMARKPNQDGLNNFKKIFDVAESFGISIALENTDKYSMKHLEYLMKNIKSKNLGFCYDVGHHNLYCPKTNLLKKFGNRLLALHLHDNYGGWHDGYDFTKDSHLLPFDGKIDFENICKKIAKTNYEDVIMLEIHKTALSTPDIYKKMDNLDYLKEAKERAEKLKDSIVKYKNLKEKRNEN